MDIEDEPRRRHRLRAADGTGLGHVPGREPGRGCRWPAVDRQFANLGQWHAEGLHDVPKRGHTIADDTDVPVPVSRRQKHAQLSGEPDLCFLPAHAFRISIVPDRKPDRASAAVPVGQQGDVQ
jgi:hypothetical protein